MYYPKLKERPPNFRINRGIGHPLAKGNVLALLGRFPGTATAYDSSVYGHDGSLTNISPPTGWKFVPQLRQWAIDFDGVDDYVYIGYKPALFPTTGITLCAWVNIRGLNSANKGQAIIDSRYNGSTNAYGYVLQVGGESDRRQVRAWLYSSGWNGGGGSFMVTYGQWYHIAATWSQSSGVLRYYVNGVVTDELSGLTFSIQYNPGCDVTIGETTVTTLSYERVNGLIASPIVFARALSGSEISALADPDNVDLRMGGVPLILPPKRVWWPAATIAPIVTKKTPWHMMIQGAI